MPEATPRLLSLVISVKRILIFFCSRQKLKCLFHFLKWKRHLTEILRFSKSVTCMRCSVKNNLKNLCPNCRHFDLHKLCQVGLNSMRDGVRRIWHFKTRRPIFILSLTVFLKYCFVKGLLEIFCLNYLSKLL